MTHLDPGSPDGGGRREDEDPVLRPGEPEGHEGAEGASEGPRNMAGGASDEFLGVEKAFWMRLLYIIAAGFVAWVSFWFLIILAVAQIIYRMAAGRTNDDLRGFTRNMIQYLRDLLAFVTLVRDERPFLFGGKFPDTRGDEYDGPPR